MWLGDAGEEAGGGGHDLHEAAGAGAGDQGGVEVRFGAGDGIDQGGIDGEAAGGAQAGDGEAGALAGAAVGAFGELGGEAGEAGLFGDQHEGAVQGGRFAGVGPEEAEFGFGAVGLADLQQGEGALAAGVGGDGGEVGFAEGFARGLGAFQGLAEDAAGEQAVEGAVFGGGAVEPAGVGVGVAEAEMGAGGPEGSGGALG